MDLQSDFSILHTVENTEPLQKIQLSSRWLYFREEKDRTVPGPWPASTRPALSAHHQHHWQEQPRHHAHGGGTCPPGAPLQPGRHFHSGIWLALSVYWDLRLLVSVRSTVSEGRGDAACPADPGLPWFGAWALAALWVGPAAGRRWTSGHLLFAFWIQSHWSYTTASSEALIILFT